MADDSDAPEKWFLVDAVLQNSNAALGSSAAIMSGESAPQVRATFMESLINQHSAAGWGIRTISCTEITDLIITRRPTITITHERPQEQPLPQLGPVTLGGEKA